jgi:hypothetical protein
MSTTRGIDLLQQLVPGGLASSGGGRTDERIHGSAFFVKSAIPSTPIAEGDILLHLCSRKISPAKRATLHGYAKRVSRWHFPEIIAHTEALECLFTSWYWHTEPHADLVATLNRIWKQMRARGINPPDGTSPLLLLRLQPEPVTQPIEAASDDAALFELLAQVRCRLPLRPRSGDKRKGNAK